MSCIGLLPSDLTPIPSQDLCSPISLKVAGGEIMPLLGVQCAMVNWKSSSLEKWQYEDNMLEVVAYTVCVTLAMVVTTNGK